MGTRSATGFIIGGVEKVSYNQFDGYPGGVGVQVLEFIRDNDLDVIKKAADRIILINDKQKPTKAQIKECAPFTDLGVSNQSTDDWYCLLRKAQGDFNAYTKGGLRYMEDKKDFLHDSLFCEYAYLINLDSGKLELYRGFNKNPKAAGRYASIKEDDWYNERTKETVKAEYYGVTLYDELPLADLQKLLRSAKAGAQFSKKQAKIIEKITAGWTANANDQYEAAQKMEKEAAEGAPA